MFNATAELGTVRSYITFIIFSLIGAVLIFVAIVLFFKDQSNLIDSVGTVREVINCIKGQKQSYECELSVRYIVNGVPYQNRIQTNGKLYNSGSNVDITYDKTNPNDVKEKTMSYRTLSYILFAFAILMISLAYGSYYLASKSKIYSAALGVDSVLSVFE